jgi:hypothetical protein
MSKRLTVNDILPLVADLTPLERTCLIRLMVELRGADEASIYRAIPPAHDEFSTDEEPLAWDAEGWEEFG